ncbi:interleukin-like EMT inducer domain-containing protein [uncultured Alistipes sp.]|uniref:interleukin-like EMT inducer domain-containing protein n=1 Tax=uncultured Alistipes sp. TaxID=538949 RepID=UPI00262D803D|nr:interleukin-like EMT inducer domain-containing protein [uncultured Alistipes sp.]
MIKDIKELNFPQYATLCHATVNLTDMAEKTISTQIKIDGDITPDFSKEWEVEFQGEKYIMPLRQPQGAKENTSLHSSIDLTFQHWAVHQLKRWMFFTVQPVETGTAVADKYIASVQLNLNDFINLFSQVLQYYYGDTITISLYSGWESKDDPVFIDINHSYIWDVLIKFYELFAVRWQIEPSSTNSNTTKGGERYVIKVGYPTAEADHIFEYGFDGGLLKVERQVQSDDIRNMLLGRGGNTNIPKFYFKKSDDEELFRSDPDWVPELANIYFDRLRGHIFRDYIRGWKTNPNRQKTYIDKDGKTHALSVEIYDAPYGESNWAYKLGHEDTKFNPVEYVKDDDSIAKYGPLLGGLDDNEDIYPSIQGSGMDVAVAVEQVMSDDVEEAVKSDAQTSNLDELKLVAYSVPHNERRTIAKRGFDFEVPQGKMANFDYGRYDVSGVYKGKKIIGITFFADEFGGEDIVIESVTANIYNRETGEKRSAVGIPSGHYYYEIVVELQNNDRKEREIDITVSFPNSNYTFVDEQKNKFINTFDIWIKNIWETTKLSSETDSQYAERVWKPILGDREQNTAKVMFTTGALATSEDYEFTIVNIPEYDTSESYTDTYGEEHSSHWRIKLAKSDADLESTGLYVPSTQRQGKAGDKFVFIGTEMTHHYVVWAEKALDDWKTDNLRETKDIKPTWVVTTDRVRLNNEGKPNALIQQLKVGSPLRLADKRFIPIGENKAYETLYLQSITYTYREPSSDDAALNPDVEIVLSNEYATTANPVATIQGEISSIQRQLGSISNIEQIVRAVGDRLYLRKDGIPDRSLSPTQFFSLLTSGDFRNGIVGGQGWGFFRDENDNWVLEADRVNVRQEMQVNNLVINQASARGGMEVDTAAFMEVTRVVEDSDGYVCYFDQKQGSIANLFHVDDVAYCNRWTAENEDLKFYKRRVTAVTADSITLTKGLSETERPASWPDSGVNGTGIPAEKDNIIHFGNYTDHTRQYVKIRDVVGGGYERFMDGLDSVNSSGTEYYFVGRQAGMYNNRPRWYIGDSNGYIEWINGVLNIKGRINMLSTIDNKPIQDYVNDAAQSAAEVAKAELQANIDILQDQVDGVVEAWSFAYSPTNSNYPASEWDDEGKKQAHVGDVFYNIQPAFNADGTTNPDAGKAWRWSQADSEHAGYHWHPIADSDAVKALQLAQMSVKDTDVLYISYTSDTEAPPLPVVDANGVITDAKGWTTTAPQWQKDRYIWQTTYVRKGNGSASFSDPTCIQGAKGADGSDGASYASNIFPSKYFNLSDEGARLTKAGNLTQASIIANNTVARFYLVPAYSPIRAASHFSISMWARVTAGTISLMASINDCWLMSFTEIDTSWKRLTGTIYVYKYIGQHGFIDFVIKGTGDIANVRISDVVITPTDKPMENWVPTADEMTGTPAKSVRITGSQVFNYKDDFATLVGPSSITLTATLQGTTGYLWEYSTDGGNTWLTFKYPNGQTLNLLPSGDMFPGNSRSVVIRCTSGGVYDEMTIYKVSSGANGSNGADAYTIIITNESHIFEGDTEKAIAASTSCGVIAYKGATRVPATIGTISGTATGMTTAIANNATTSATVTISVTSALTSKQGILNIPVTVDGNVFNKTFSWSLSLEGKSARSIIVKSSGYSGSVVGGHGYVKVDDIKVTESPLRGLTITTIDRKTLNKVSEARYDLWAGNSNVETERIKFIDKIDALTSDVFACIMFRDNVTWTSGMIEAMKKLGSLGNINDIGVYRTFAFIGYKGLTPGYALQAQGENGATPPVEVSAYVANGMFTTAPTQIGIKSITEQYYLSTSIEIPTGGYWSDTKPTWDPDKVYWTRSKITYTDGSVEYVGETCADVYVYSIGSTVDNITKDATGNLSVSSFTVTKYVSSSTTPLSATKRNTLKYIRTTSFGPQVETLASGHGASTGYTVNINDDDRAFVFKLYDDKNNLLSSKRIPIIDSTTGLEVGTNNYALNTATEKKIIFKNDTSWQVDELYTVKDIQVGDTLILGFSYALSALSGESGAYLDVYMDFGHATLEIEPDIDNVLGVETLGFANFVSKPVKVTKGQIGQSGGVGVIKLGHKYITGGLLTIRELCLQKGNVYTGWNRSSFDFDYLTEALKEQGSFEGGLILASLMKLGYTAKDGYKTLSGLNGIYSDIKKGGGLAFWAGGDQIDAEEDSVNGATSGIRMDGTAYFAGNTIRFKENTIEIGNNIVLDKDALSMFSSNAECVRISNTAVSLSEADITNSNPYSVNGTVPLGSISIYKIDDERYTMSSSENYFGGSYTATKKCTLRLSFSGNISSTSVPISKKLLGRMQVSIYKGSSVYQTLIQELRPMVSSITNSLSVSYVFSVPLASAGVYKFSVKFTPSISSTEQEEVGYAANNNLIITGKITPEMSSKTLLGNNGLLSIWNNAGMCINSNSFIAMVGKYGIKITSTGIQIMKNGTWSSL